MLLVLLWVLIYPRWLVLLSSKLGLFILRCF